MKFLIDMNLPPSWRQTLNEAGWESAHWTEVGQPGDDDIVLMDYARQNDYVILTHDLDFGTLLALTAWTGPSVCLIRDQNTLPRLVGTSVVAAIKQFEKELTNGALLSVNVTGARVRMLPIKKR